MRLLDKKQGREFVDRIKDTGRFGIIEGSKPEDWLQCGQLQNEFLPAYNYRPGMSAQVALASEIISEGKSKRFKMGLIGSTDNHKARAGSGYKEFAKKAMGDSWGAKDQLNLVTAAGTRRLLLLHRWTGCRSCRQL